MPIYPVHYKRKNGSARYDPAKKAYVGYRIDVLVAGRRHRDGGFASRRQAQEFIDRLKADARDRRNGLSVNTKSPLVSELFDKRLARISHKRVHTLASRVFRDFQELLDSDCTITEMRSGHFQLYVNSRKVSASSIRRELAELSAAFRSVPEIFPELDNYSPPIIKRPKKAKLATKHVVTKEEKDAIVSHLQGNEYQKRIGRMFSVAWFLGLRYGEIVKLKKSDLKDRTLKVVRWKTNDVTLFEDLPDEVLAILRDAIEASETEFIFPSKQVYPNSFYKEFGKAVEASGLIYGKGKLDSVVFHSARHSYITRLIQVTDFATAKAFSGHSTDAMLAHYTHATKASKKEAMRKLYGSEDLKKVYNAVRKGKMTFEEFKKVMR